MTRTAARTLLALILSLSAVITGPQVVAFAAPATGYADEPGCDWQATFQAVLVGLDENPDDWTTADLSADNAWGMTYMDDSSVAIDPTTPCPLLRDVMRHEHMHRVQHALYGTNYALLEAHGGAEQLADCANVLQGAEYAPYVGDSPSAAQLGTSCTAQDMAMARWLIDVGQLAHDGAAIGWWLHTMNSVED